jgi:hypothetical protein
VFVDDGWPMGQCQLGVGHTGLCDVSLFVTCETTAAISLHIREVGETPINYSGFAQRPTALCGAIVAWDTKISLNYSTCSTCDEKWKARKTHAG